MKKSKGQIAKAAFLTEGGTAAYAIGYRSMQRSAPEDESAVACLASGGGSRVFGITHGRRSHLFFYDSWSIDNFAFLLRPVAEDTVAGEIFCMDENLCYGIATSRVGEDGVRNTMFRYDASTFLVGLEMWVEPGEFEEIACPFPGQRLSRFAVDRAAQTAYCILRDDRVLVAYDVAGGSVRQLASLGEGRISGVVALDHLGRVYCVGEWGALLRYDPGSDILENTGQLIPAGKGKEYVNEASAFAFDAVAKTLYGGTLVDGYVFRFDVERGELTCIGKPTDQRHVRAMAVIPDGRLYGVVGEPRTGMVHLFSFDPVGSDLRDLGLVAAAQAETWVAHEVDSMVVNGNGHIVMGENDRMSHIFAYYPPIRPRPVSTAAE